MQLKEDVDDSWFNELEVYSADITFNSLEDYGATISCGDNILVDHILEFDFEKDQIVDIRMNGQGCNIISIESGFPIISL